MRPRGDSESPSATNGSASGPTVTGGLQGRLVNGEGAAIVSRPSTPGPDEPDNGWITLLDTVRLVDPPPAVP